MLKITLFAALIFIVGAAAELEEVFKWNELSFDWPSEEAKNEALENGDYIPENNLLLGLYKWKNKMFVSIPRWRDGVAATLNYISLNSTSKSPVLVPYPDWKANTLPKEGETPEDNLIVSTFRMRVDACDRLWVLDTGMADRIEQAMHIYDLNTDTLLRKYTMEGSYLKGTISFFANIVIDVTKNTCDHAFAYMFDLAGNGLLIYSFATDNAWRFEDNSIFSDRFQGDFSVRGNDDFHWSDGIFSKALGSQKKNGFRPHFHAMISTNEFSVNTQDPKTFKLFKHEGSKGESSQSLASVFDGKTKILFHAQLGTDTVTCWNSKKKLEPANMAIVVDDRKLEFISDITIDDNRYLWIMSDRFASYRYLGLSANEVHYRIFKVPVDEVLAGTVGGAVDLEEVFEWKEVSFEWPSKEAKNESLKNGKYIPGNNSPLSLGKWKN
ncbi:hypothetical protein JTB14_008045 [Gonioctena quinquepunctata]|nr:hypothetical protein JTB14_008045 [Gonioctena quinquepunctata]